MSNRVQIQTSASENPKMREIYDILLMAGYFRIRIPTIKDFDKIMGGLTWCITCSNFDIDIEYNEDMKLGEKIKLSEKVCTVLKDMKCPFSLQPFQIQGLDSNSLFPIIQWLIKFVYETRELRQDFNKKMSYFLGQNVYMSFQNKEARERKQLEITQENFLKDTDKRQTKNSKIKKTSRKDPLRIYSTLIEYGDVSAYKTYNKLCAIMSGNVSLEDKGGKIQSKLSQFESENKDHQQNSHVNSLLFHGTNTIQGGEVNIAADQDDFQLDQSQIQNFKDIGNMGNKIGDQLINLIDSDKINSALQEQENNEQDKDDPINLAKLVQNENQFHQGQVAAMNKKVIQLENNLQEISDELYELKSKEEQLIEQHQNHLNLYEELGQTQNNIQEQIEAAQGSKNQAELDAAQALVEQKSDLEDQKKQLRKNIKTEQEELESDRQRLEKEIPQYEDNQDYFVQLYNDVNEKKEKYEEKFKQLAELNQQIAVLQRKLEGVPSPTEIAQYHQRLQELFENINQENLKYKDKFIKYNAGSDIKDMLKQFVEIMRTFKENFQANRKSKSGRENFIGELGETRRSMLTNLEKSIEFLRKQIASRDEKSNQLIQFEAQEREYFKLLKELRMEFEKSDDLQEQLQIYYNQQQQQQQQQ